MTKKKETYKQKSERLEHEIEYWKEEVNFNKNRYDLCLAQFKQMKHEKSAKKKTLLEQVCRACIAFLAMLLYSASTYAVMQSATEETLVARIFSSMLVVAGMAVVATALVSLTFWALHIIFGWIKEG